MSVFTWAIDELLEDMGDMSESKHTPGPWSPGNTREPDITAADGKLIASWDESDFRFERTHANAQLIAAAPDLLEGLEMAVDFLQSPLPDDGEGASNLVDELLPIIRKAKGVPE